MREEAASYETNQQQGGLMAWATRIRTGPAEVHRPRGLCDEPFCQDQQDYGSSRFFSFWLLRKPAPPFLERRTN